MAYVFEVSSVIGTMKSNTLARDAIPRVTLPTDKVLLDMLYYMKLTRELEYRIERKLYRQGKIVGGVYVGRGQEAIAVGSCIDLRQDDVVCPSHRDMGAYLIRGMALRTILAQYMGRKTGATRGKDGNMHMGDLSKGLIAFVSMLGDNVPVAAGIALSFKMRGQDRVTLCFFGDGATSRGDWHEGVNMAAVFKAPVVFICNNNQYAYSTPLERQMAVENIADRAEAYGMPGEIVDGNDILAVWEAAKRAIQRARAGEGPTLIECKTFRMTGHSAHDDAGYVPPELFEFWEERDPINRFERFLIDRGLIDKAGIEELQRRINHEIDEAIQLAEKDPFPEPEDCLKDVYYEE
jgi:pyruvate dehydrogenase E1 component alpha subunit